MPRQKKRRSKVVVSRQLEGEPVTRKAALGVCMSALGRFFCIASGCASDVVRRIRKCLSEIRVQKRQRLLRVCETVPLGEKRIMAVVEAGGQLLLVGGAANSVSLLTTLENTRDIGSMFSCLLKQCESRSSVIQ